MSKTSANTSIIKKISKNNMTSIRIQLLHHNLMENLTILTISRSSWHQTPIASQGRHTTSPTTLNNQPKKSR